MRVAVFGSGGVGGYFGGRLAEAGEEVVFIARGSHLQAMQEQGLRVESVNGNFHLQPVRATGDPAQVGPVDVVLLGVKAWQVTGAARAIQPLVGAHTCVVPLQNGVEAAAQLAAVLGDRHVLGGLCRVVSFIAGPGSICHMGGEPYVAFGELDNQSSERVERLRQAFDRAKGVTVEVPPDIQVAIWSKFLAIAPFSGIGAVTRAPAGIWRSRPEIRQLWLEAMREVFEVARARGVNLPEETIGTSAAFMDSLPPGATASMQRDIMAGLPSELESQNGAVVRLGQEAGVPTPIHRVIYASLLPLELKARGEVDF